MNNFHQTSSASISRWKFHISEYPLQMCCEMEGNGTSRLFVHTINMYYAKNVHIKHRNGWRTLETLSRKCNTTTSSHTTPANSPKIIRTVWLHRNISISRHTFRKFSIIFYGMNADLLTIECNCFCLNKVQSVESRVIVLLNMGWEKALR